MKQEITTSKQFTINWRDIAKGVLMAVLTPVIVIVQNSVAAGSLSFDKNNIVMAAVAGFVGYLVKNFFTPAQTVITNEKA